MRNTNCFTSKDLTKIKRNTNYNNHGENYEFIAKKVNSKTLNIFRKINKGNTEGLNYDTYQKQHQAYKRLMSDVKKVCPKDYKGVYSRT